MAIRYIRCRSRAENFGFFVNNVAIPIMFGKHMLPFEKGKDMLLHTEFFFNNDLYII